MYYSLKDVLKAKLLMYLQLLWPREKLNVSLVTSKWAVLFLQNGLTLVRISADVNVNVDTRGPM